MKSLKITSAVFCNTASPTGEAGKLDCRGLFTAFYAWGYPTSTRAWKAIVALYGLKVGTTKLSISISRKGKKKEFLGEAEITRRRGQKDLGSIFAIPLICRFHKEGLYTVHFSVVGTKEILKIPVIVSTHPWPKFRQAERQFAEKTDTIAKAFRAAVACSECKYQYVFEESILSDHEYAPNVLPFPRSNVFVCECGHEMHLKDIRGRVRSSLKNTVRSAMGKDN